MYWGTNKETEYNHQPHQLPTFDKDPISYHDNAPMYLPTIIKPWPMLMQHEYHKLSYKYPHYYHHTLTMKCFW